MVVNVTVICVVMCSCSLIVVPQSVVSKPGSPAFLLRVSAIFSHGLLAGLQIKFLTTFIDRLNKE